MNPTITVPGWNGKPKILTRDEFIKRWADHCCEVSNLCETSEDYRTYDIIMEQIKLMAGRKFDLTLSQQRSKP